MSKNLIFFIDKKLHEKDFMNTLLFSKTTILSGFVLFCVGCASVPYTNRKQFVTVSAQEESAMGLQAYQDVLKKEKISTDANATAMVKRVGGRIAAVAERPDFKWEFNLIDNPKVPNAFCLPGGKVAVYSGLLPTTKDEAGLAVVMSHEVAHALARHGAERMSQGQLVGLEMLRNLTHFKIS
jgi:predicted Zn-dependent protease